MTKVLDPHEFAALVVALERQASAAGFGTGAGVERSEGDDRGQEPTIPRH